MKMFFPKIAAILLFLISYQDISAITLIPTFENCSYYYDYTGTVSIDKSWNTSQICRIWFREKPDGEWEEAISPVYDAVNKQFRGSIMYLKEKTEYAVKVEVNEGGTWQVKDNGSFTTWTSNPPIAMTINLSNLSGYVPNRGISLSNLKGNANGWIKIIGDVPIHAAKTTEQALKLNGCEYVILENFTLTGGSLHGINILENCNNIRITGADISAWGRVPVDQVYLADAVHYPESKYKGDDATYIGDDGVVIRNDAGIYMVTTRNDLPHSNIVIERCYIHDPNGWCNAWYGTRTLGYGAGTEFRFLHPQGPQGIYVRSSGGTVIRYNDVTGNDFHRLHDLIGGKDNGKPYGGLYRDADIYGNFLAFSQDDGIELDAAQRNIRFYDNRIEQARCGVSTAPNLAGPSYLVRNLIHNLGDSNRENGAAIKNGGGTTYSKGMHYFLNNTMYVPASCIAGVGYGSDKDMAMFQGFSRNNILCSTIPANSYGGNGIHEVNGNGNNSFDYDLLCNTTAAKMEGSALLKTPGCETHAIKGNPLFGNQPNAVYSLQDGSPALESGEKLNNIATGINGKNPDMGAIGKGSSSLMPKRPLEIEADSYFVQIHPQGSATVRFPTGNIPTGLSLRITQNADMDWLTVTPSTQEIYPNTSFEINLKASDKTGKTRYGCFFVRFSNGISIPVSIATDKNSPSSIEENNLSDVLIKISGNTLSMRLPEDGMIKIFDMSGSCFHESNYSEGLHTKQLTLPSGIYIVSYRSEKINYTTRICNRAF